MSLINALKSYKQCDEDGIMCKVSRQAVDEAIERIKQLQAENERLRKEVEVQGFNLRLRKIDGSVDVDALIKDAERYEKIKLMSFSQFKDIVSKRMDGTGKTLDELLDEWELPF